MGLALIAACVAPIGTSAKDFSDADRIACTLAVEEVRWSQRIWPKENVSSKPPLSHVFDRQSAQRLVRDAARMERALAQQFDVRLTISDMQSELDRMVRNTRAPEQLRRLFAALDNDPQRLAECLVRPALVKRRLQTAYWQDTRLHAPVRERALDALHEIRAGALPSGIVQTIEQSATPPVARVPRPDGFLRAPTSRPGSTPDRKGVVDVGSAFEFRKPFVGSDGRPATRVWTWPKVDFHSWWQKNASTFDGPIKRLAATALRVPSVEKSVLSNFTGWRPEGAPSGRRDAMSLWTGDEMLIWGGHSYDGGGTRMYLYDPATDSWRTVGASISSNVPAVWTGSEAVFWSGRAETSGRYDPRSDTWRPMSMEGSPTERTDASLVWTGTELIVFGGAIGLQTALSDGGRYSPSEDRWTAIPETTVVAGRSEHSAVWTGQEMLVWGGMHFVPSENGGYLAQFHVDGGRFDPVSGEWTALEGEEIAPPSIEPAHWTGTLMVIWNGYAGALFDPAANSWSAISDIDAPLTGFSMVTAWTGTELLVWGTSEDWENDYALIPDQARYEPATDTWKPMSTSGSPGVLAGQTSVWTGEELIVWGGSTNAYMGPTSGAGARYDPDLDRWVTFDAKPPGRPTPRAGSVSVWTGAEFIIWGGNEPSAAHGTGGQYDPVLDRWQPVTQLDAPSPRTGHAAVWTGLEMIVVGGQANASDETSEGGRYDPASDSWIALPPDGRDTRDDLLAFWSGRELLVWGGTRYWGDPDDHGDRFDPLTNQWTPMSSVAAPVFGRPPAGVWTGTEMLVWGGDNGNVPGHGARYDPVLDTWTAISEANAPTGREAHSAIWTGSEMVVWGGGIAWIVIHGRDTGARYSPESDSWTPTSLVEVPPARHGHSAVWTGEEMIVWGGRVEVNSPTATGGHYAPAVDQWRPTALQDPPPAADGNAVWSDGMMLVWPYAEVWFYRPSPIVPSRLLLQDGFESVN